MGREPSARHLQRASPQPIPPPSSSHSPCPLFLVSWRQQLRLPGFSFLRGDKIVASLPPSPAPASCRVAGSSCFAFDLPPSLSRPFLFYLPFIRQGVLFLLLRLLCFRRFPLRHSCGSLLYAPHMPVVACECTATMSSDKMAARKGRLRQRYDNEHRLVAGCVPYRVKKNGDGNPCSSPGDDDPAQVEVLMISTPNRTDMVFPKGGWEDDEDVYQAACREAMEEAGVKGIIDSSALGHWVFKSKSSQSSNSPRGGCKGFIFAMEVTEELESWPEQATHSRRWVSPAEAYQLCRYDWMREALTALLERLSVMEPEATAGAAAQELTDQASMYMMLQTTSDGAVALC